MFSRYLVVYSGGKELSLTTRILARDEDGVRRTFQKAVGDLCWIEAIMNEETVHIGENN